MHVLAKKRILYRCVGPYEDGWILLKDGGKPIISNHRKQSVVIGLIKVSVKRYKTDVIIDEESGGIRE